VKRNCEEKGTGPPGRLPAACASNAGGQGGVFRATQVVVRPRRICKRECARMAFACLSAEELTEFL
jgi:hypothetical protein